MRINFKQILVITALVFTAAGQLRSPQMSYIGIACIILSMLNNNAFENYKICLMLIPMIRIFDSTGITIIVNILLVVPLIILVIEQRSINKTAFIHTSILMTLEFFHTVAFNNMNSVIANLSAILPLMYCESVLLKEDEDLEPISMSRWLSIGILFSAAVYLLGHRAYFGNIIKAVIRGARFEAYADDPNYYSLYIIMALIGIIEGKKHSKSDYILLVLLVATGMLTASKMCTIMMMVTFSIYGGNYLISENYENRRFISRVLVIVIAAVIIFGDEINQLLIHMLSRLMGRNTVISLGSITTGRSQIAFGYLIALFNDPIAILFGYGFQYRTHFDIILGNRNYTSVAHNTFLDVILSWGIFGLLIVIWIVLSMMHRVKGIKVEESALIVWYPFIALLIMIMALSCLSAGMFWYMLTLSLLLVKNYNNRSETLK